MLEGINVTDVGLTVLLIAIVIGSGSGITSEYIQRLFADNLPPWANGLIGLVLPAGAGVGVWEFMGSDSVLLCAIMSISSVIAAQGRYELRASRHTDDAG